LAWVLTRSVHLASTQFIPDGLWALGAAAIFGNGKSNHIDRIRLRLYRAVGDKANEAGALNDVGWYHGFLGDYQQARAFCRQAVTLSAEADDRWLEGDAWGSLGYAEHGETRHAAREPAQAREAWQPPQPSA
jgi:hypothetical protein